MSPVVDLDLTALDRVLRVNLRGTFVVDQQAARRVRAGGAIIDLSSSITRFARPGYAAYAATKGGVEAITLILARELRGRDITVNTVAPGPIATALFFEGKDEQLVARIAAEPPMERLGTPADIAEIVAFLAGPARWINGQVLYANGGAMSPSERVTARRTGEGPTVASLAGGAQASGVLRRRRGGSAVSPGRRRGCRRAVGRVGGDLRARA